jgi:hypothetical protein
MVVVMMIKPCRFCGRIPKANEKHGVFGTRACLLNDARTPERAIYLS